MENNLEILKTLFKGREDVFAIRWERNGKAGYMPAYDFDWSDFFAHKANGGNLKSFANKEYASLGGHVWMFFEEPYPAFKNGETEIMIQAFHFHLQQLWRVILLLPCPWV